MYISKKKHRNSRKLRGGAGKVNTKKAGKGENKKKAEPTEEDLMRTLQDSFTTSWVIGDDTIKMGPKKMKERVREQYFQALEEQNKKAEEKVSSVKGIQVKQADQNSLGKAIATGFREGESAYSQYQRGIQRVGQGARSVGLNVKTNARALGSQIGDTFGSKGKSAASRAFNTARSKARNRSTGMGTRSSPARSTGAPPLPGAVGATSLSPIPALPSDASFTKTGDQVEGTTTAVNNKTTTVNSKGNTKNTTSKEINTKSKEESKNCPCCQRELAEGAEPITIDSVKNVWSDLKVELAGEKAKSHKAKVDKVLGGKEEINKKVKKLKEAKEAMEKAMEAKRKEVLRDLDIDGNLNNEQIDEKIEELEKASKEVDSEANKLGNNLKKQRDKEKRERCIADSNAIKSAEINEKEEKLEELEKELTETQKKSNRKNIEKEIKKIKKEIKKMESNREKTVPPIINNRKNREPRKLTPPPILRMRGVSIPD